MSLRRGLIIMSFFAYANGPGTKGIAPSTAPEASGDTSIFGRSRDPDIQKRLDERQEMQSEVEGRPSGVNVDHEKQKKELEERGRKRSQPN